MSNKRAAGFTLVEMIVAMVIISVGIAGVLGVLMSTATQSADPMVRKQMTAIAEGMMEEIQLKPFANPATGAPAAGGCARLNFDEVTDYAGYNQAVCDIDGTPGAPGYNVQVTVAVAAGAVLTGGIPAGDALRIDVQVTRGGENYTLVGWRNNYGADQP